MQFDKIAFTHVKLFLFSVVMLLAGGLAQAQEAATQSGAQQKVDQLIKLLNDPEVRGLLSSRSAAAPTMMPNMSASALTTVLNSVQGHLRAVVEAVPLVPGEFSRATTTIMTDIDNRTPLHVLTLFLLLVAIGLCAEFGFSHIVRRIHAKRLAIGRGANGQSSGLHVAGRHFFARLAPLVAFASGSVGLFLLLNWPPLLGELIVPTLLGLIAARVVIRLGEVLLAPDLGIAEQTPVRLVPMNDAAARFWYSRIVVVTLVFFFGWSAEGIMSALNFIPPVKFIVGYAIGIGLLAAAIEIAWHRPRPGEHAVRHSIFDWLVTFWLSVLWILWVAGLDLMMLLGVYVILLPAALRIATAVIRTAFLPRDAASTSESPVYQVLVERGVRAGIIAIAVMWLAMIVGLQATAMSENAQVAGIVRGVLTGIVILLAADIVWQIAKALISHRLSVARAAEGNAADIARSDRLLTLLPIFRNFLAVLIGAIAVMMVLSAFGVEVGPLIAGAGIFGVAIGFGAQALVKDIISGIFYMTDDAFRVGEYIQSGSYKGTVESFSLRSVRLRHHRGPIFTVPFGTLGAVENMSRDWVIDKFLISVSYQTDVALVKKLVKGIGAQLLEDPELGPTIIETVKMKGVEQFGDYGINLSFAMTTKPGQQSTVRRRALVMIREAFAANGIEFASPTVQVGKDDRAVETIAALVTNNAIAEKRLAGEAS